MPIIHIYGASGSGTTTLGKAIHHKYGYSHFDTDDYFWVLTDPPFTQKRSAKERFALLRNDIGNLKNAVISGSLCDWGDELIPLFDLVVRLVVPTDDRLRRLEKREFHRFSTRILEGGDMYQEHTDFMQWSSEYDTGDASMRSKAMHDKWQKLITCKHLTLDGTMPVEDLLKEIETNLISQA